jgi:acyl dehydratase
MPSKREEGNSEEDMHIRYFEDFHVGDVFDLGSIQVTEEEIITFAKQFDPQPFHIDPERAKDSIFRGLVASGAHTTALFMRLLVDGLLSKTISIASPGVDEVRWRNPVRPGDQLRGRLTVVECIPSRSRPTMGILRSACEMVNQEDKVVLTLSGIHFVGRKPDILSDR